MKEIVRTHYVSSWGDKITVTDPWVGGVLVTEEYKGVANRWDRRVFNYFWPIFVKSGMMRCVDG